MPNDISLGTDQESCSKGARRNVQNGMRLLHAGCVKREFTEPIMNANASIALGTDSAVQGSQGEFTVTTVRHALHSVKRNSATLEILGSDARSCIPPLPWHKMLQNKC